MAEPRRRWAATAGAVLGLLAAAVAFGPSQTPVGTITRPAPAAACVAKPGQYTQAELNAVNRKLIDNYVTYGIEGNGVGKDSVEVDLLPGREAEAARLEATFGNAVQLSVGETSYCHGPGRTATCPSLKVGNPLPPGLVLTLKVDQATMTPTDLPRGTLEVSERGPGHFVMDPGQPLVASMVRTGTLKVIGTFGGAIAGTGFPLNLGPGQTRSIPVFVGTSRCDGGIGSAIPAGHYGVRVVLAPEGRPRTPSYLVAEVPITVR